jgi:TPR repeat protein
LNLAKKNDKYDDYISILEEGSENNDPECIYHLGLSYIGLNGYKLRQDKLKALNLFKKNNNHFKSMAMICVLLASYDNFDKIEVYDLGIKILNSLGNHFAKGYCFKYGFGTEKAFKEFLTSVEEGDDQGQYEVGYCFKYGLGVEKDKKKAPNILKKYLC